jgi:SAM-dependent methyltransferase
MAEPRNSYDEIPYKSLPYPQTRPERLATIATLFSMQPKPVAQCRVLELGCASGGNLIPLAARFPESTFLGIDYSSRQISAGKEVIDQLGLSNIQLQNKNILDVGREIGHFDYAIAHGVYSWVPRDERDKLLEICSQCLSPNGVAYVSYNTFPGWKLRGTIRDIMCFRAKSVSGPADRLAQSRDFIRFISESIGNQPSAYGLLLREELAHLFAKDPGHLSHDYLEDVNEPVYFHEFVSHIRRHGLQYLGEATYSTMALDNFPRKVRDVLRKASTNLTELEQNMDFLRNRMFRETLLCHEQVEINRTALAAALTHLHISSSARPDSDVVSLAPSEPVIFRIRHARITSRHPILTAALLHLGQIWPRTESLAALLSASRAWLAAKSIPRTTSSDADELTMLAQSLLGCYAKEIIELSTSPTTIVFDQSMRPTAFSIAKLQSHHSELVTNTRHEIVKLNAFQRLILSRLDGLRDSTSLASDLAKETELGLKIPGLAPPNSDTILFRDTLHSVVRECFSQLAGASLLV